ncbi:Dam family site-specific DNA-(adenine-N6)-methyltransferase [Candidatus Leptofilum sp.]|uniref:Dam family site-specific DNA-(adenine-N6)-methyltransferase n=1 Tax=Candidatus Leptofilum sp. TaxID=3241576 RepID=UPI003B5C6A8D
MKPFLKWAGNKYKLVERIKTLLPPGERLVEPFVGSGALFLNTDYPRYLLSDTNADLIVLYQYLQAEGEAFINYCRPLFAPENNDRDRYYTLRDEFNRTNDSRRKSALFLYLNKHGYNGLCRYNRKGGFNVPFGRYKRPYFPEAEMHHFAQQARHAIFQQANFVATMATCQSGDVVYCDPPYVPLTSTANFTSYSANGFGWAEQQELARQATKLAQRGVPVIISNHDTEEVRQVYEAAEINTFEVRRFISCNGDKREKAAELLALFSS